MSLRYQIIPVTPFQQNCSVLWCTETLEAAVIDPGGEWDRIEAVVKAKGLKLSLILLTHGHLDHASAAGLVSQATGLPIWGPQAEDQFWIDGLPQQARAYGFPAVSPFLPDRWLNDGESLQLGQEELQVLHCPGHTPGHVVFFSKSARRAFVGDVLFVGSIGRTDFPRGDHASLIRSITQKLWPLGDDVVFIPGHGPEGRFGHERVHNPYVGGPNR